MIFCFSRPTVLLAAGLVIGDRSALKLILHQLKVLSEVDDLKSTVKVSTILLLLRPVDPKIIETEEESVSPAASHWFPLRGKLLRPIHH